MYKVNVQTVWLITDFKVYVLGLYNNEHVNKNSLSSKIYSPNSMELHLAIFILSDLKKIEIKSLSKCITFCKIHIKNMITILFRSGAGQVSYPGALDHSLRSSDGKYWSIEHT